MVTDTTQLINIFDETKQCVYKGETYLVRDNGAIMRCAKKGGKPRPKDNVWTFGTKNEKGYMKFVKEAVHRIVAFAFLGTPPSDDYVVDHKDTNRCNNRPENLRWVTKLENTLNNEVTLRKIIDCCGSVEAFIADPSILNSYTHVHQCFDWMRTVSKEEAQNAFANVMNWAKDTPKSMYFRGNGFSEKVYEPIPPQQLISESLTDNALQKNWKESMYFTVCPHTCSLKKYNNQLVKDVIFATSDNYTYTIIEKKFDANREVIHLILKSNSDSGCYAVAMITINAQHKYLHTLLKEYSSLAEAEKHLEQMTIQFEFTKGESTNYISFDSEWLHHNLEEDWRNQIPEYTPTFSESLTSNATQCDWKTPTEFPLCPSGDVNLEKYYKCLAKDKVFGKNVYGESVILDFAKHKGEEAFGVVTQSDNIKPYCFCKIYIKDSKYVHENYGAFFDKKGAERLLVWAQGLIWEGGEVFDDGII